MITTLAPPALDRDGFLDWYRRNRRWSRYLFDRVLPHAYESRPIPLRHPPVFYEGHLPAFSFNKLGYETYGRPPIDLGLQTLFERGIDPSDAASAATAKRAQWPSRAQVWEFGAKCDAVVEDILRNEPLDVKGDPRKERAHTAWTILEHEPMHHETFSYILHRMPLQDKVRPDDYVQPRDVEHPPQRRVEIPAGIATLGARRREITFAWDNEFEEHQLDVPRFECDVYPVTNRQWMAFVRDGGPVPSFWVEADGGFKLLTAWAVLPMLESAPVWVTSDQARQYASWAGRRVMSEAGVSSRRFRDAQRRGAGVSLGRCGSNARARKFRFPKLGRCAGRFLSARHERIRNFRVDRQRLGAHVDAVHAVRRLQAARVLPAVLCRFLRRKALCRQRRFADHTDRTHSPQFSELVLRRLSVSVRKVPNGKRLALRAHR